MSANVWLLVLKWNKIIINDNNVGKNVSTVGGLRSFSAKRFRRHLSNFTCPWGLRSGKPQCTPSNRGRGRGGLRPLVGNLHLHNLTSLALSPSWYLDHILSEILPDTTHLCRDNPHKVTVTLTFYININMWADWQCDYERVVPDTHAHM